VDQTLIDQVVAARDAAYDAARPYAVAEQHAAGRLTARERIAALCDAGSFVEYGVQAQPIPDRFDAPADGLVAGVGRVEGLPVVAASYDYTVHRGTQSGLNQNKLERMLALAVEHRWPFICFADGEGRRQRLPGESQPSTLGGRGSIGLVDGLCELSGWAPSVAVVAGPCLDGNAAIPMLSELVVATAGSVMGAAEQPIAVETHEQLGNLDVVEPDEPSAIAAVRRYLSLLLTDLAAGEPSAAAATIRTILPDNRKRAYDVRKVFTALLDAGSSLELRPRWGASLVTCLGRLGGRTVGMFGNQPLSRVAGAIDADAADKMCRFIEFCSAYGLPLVSIIDSPGFHIGPDAERQGMARHHIRTLSAIVNRSVPLYCVQLRKSYGLGPLVMTGFGGRRAPELRLAWPTVERGGMSLEGAAYLVKRREIREAATPEEARRIRDDYANTLRARESGVRAGQSFAFDEVIDPAETRDRLIAVLQLYERQRPPAKAGYLDGV
jgi:acetyl-CoA carboxylase carboxyltransferase component